jgi:helix-turn-helix protein
VLEAHSFGSGSGSKKRRPASGPQPAIISTFLERDVWICQMLATDSEVLTAGAKVLAARIALHLHVDGGRCFASLETLAKGTGVGLRHIPRVLAALERAGWLAVTRSRGGCGYANSFRLMTPKTVTPESLLQPGNSDSQVPKTVTPESPQQRGNSERGRGSAPRPLTRAGAGSPTTVGKELVLSAADGFEDLRAVWSVKPHAGDEAVERRAFEDARRRGASVNAILAGARAWADAAVAADETRYMPALAKWLGGRCWEKPPPKKPKPKPRGNGKVDLGKMMLKQGLGLEEDDDGNLFHPETMGRAQ